MRTIIFGLALLAASAHALEESRSVAVVNLKLDPSISEGAQIRAAIQQAFDANNLMDIPANTIENQKSTSPELFACFAEDRCRAELGRRLKTDYIFSGTISRDDGAL